MISNQRRYVLHIDDDEDDQNMLQEAIRLADPSLSVRKAKNGQDGLELLMQCMVLKDLPILIVLDLNMPGMDGKVVLKEIKKTPALAAIPVVLLTTSSSELDRMFAVKENVELITKPSKEIDFFAAVADILERVNKMNDD